MLLTLAPKDWGRTKLANEFNSTEREARKAIELVKEHGISTHPNKKKGKALPNETIAIVNKFYDSDDISRLMPGKNDFVPLKQDNGKREHVQKRLLLGNLSELYTEFKNEHPSVKIGFTKFSQLRPLYCVFAGSSGTHNVCVCIYHENMKLMLNAIDIEHLTRNANFILKDFRDCLNATICLNPSYSCFLNECEICPSTTAIKEMLIELFDEHESIK